jgi:hypothetical protein
MNVVSSHKYSRERPLSGQSVSRRGVVIEEAQEDITRAADDADIAPRRAGRAQAIRAPELGLGSEPAPIRRVRRDDAVEVLALADDTCAADHDLVVRPYGREITRTVAVVAQGHVDAAIDRPHAPTITADTGLMGSPEGVLSRMNSVIDEKELSLAREHPRGTERRRLLPYRDALNDVAIYASLTTTQRDVIVRWAETRRRIKTDFAIDHDPANLADPLIPAEDLRAHVLAGERLAARVADFPDPGGDLLRAVAAIRGGSAS